MKGVSLIGAITIPSTVTEIGESAFKDTKISALDLSEATSLTSIGNSAFYRTALEGTRLVIPSTVTEIFPAGTFPAGTTLYRDHWGQPWEYAKKPLKVASSDATLCWPRCPSIPLPRRARYHNNARPACFTSQVRLPLQI